MDLSLVDELRDKLNLNTLSKPVIAGVFIIICLICIACFSLLRDSFTTNGIEIESEANIEEVQENASSQEKEMSSSIFIHVSVSVVNPGLVELEEGSRLAQAIEAAGGFTDDADTSSVNLARVLNDGEQIIIASSLSQESAPLATTSGESEASASTQSASSSANGKININTASASELTELPGIGESTAEKIVADRKSNGLFSSISDITRVSGIGDKKFEAIADLITI